LDLNMSRGFACPISEGSELVTSRILASRPWPFCQGHRPLDELSGSVTTTDTLKRKEEVVHSSPRSGFKSVSLAAWLVPTVVDRTEPYSGKLYDWPDFLSGLVNTEHLPATNFSLRACTAMTGSTCVFMSSLLPFPFHSAICALTVPLRPVFIGTR